MISSDPVLADRRSVALLSGLHFAWGIGFGAAMALVAWGLIEAGNFTIDCLSRPWGLSCHGISEKGKSDMEIAQMQADWKHHVLQFLPLAMGFAALQLGAGALLAVRRGRMMCQGLAWVNVVMVPVGTALGVLTILVLRRPGVRDLLSGRSRIPIKI